MSNSERCTEHGVTRCIMCRAKAGEISLPASRPRMEVPPAPNYDHLPEAPEVQHVIAGGVEGEIPKHVEQPVFGEGLYSVEPPFVLPTPDDSHEGKVRRASSRYIDACVSYEKTRGDYVQAQKHLNELKEAGIKAKADREAARTDLQALISSAQEDSKPA